MKLRNEATPCLLLNAATSMATSIEVNGSKLNQLPWKLIDSRGYFR